MTVHNNIKKDLGITFGSIVYIGGNPNTKTSSRAALVQALHNEQVKLINNNYDIIAGSSLAYNSYMNGKYNIFSDQKIDSTGAINGIHVTSAGLSQIGKDTANNIANSGLLK